MQKFVAQQPPIRLRLRIRLHDSAVIARPVFLSVQRCLLDRCPDQKLSFRIGFQPTAKTMTAYDDLQFWRPQRTRGARRFGVLRTWISL